MLGYYSNNPDIQKKHRSLDVKVVKKGFSVTMARKEYVLKSPQKPIVPTPPPAPAQKPKA